jgi:hypothetical protein
MRDWPLRARFLSLEWGSRSVYCRPVAVGIRVAPYPPPPGRNEARNGLRMMPPSRRSPMSFRTAVFPQYGWKAGTSDWTFPVHPPLKACSRHASADTRFASVLRAPRGLSRCSRSVSGRRLGSAPPWSRVVLRPRGPRSGPGYSLPVLPRLSAPSAPLAGTSRFHRRCDLRDVSALRQRLGDRRVVRGFRCTFLPGMPPPMSPGRWACGCREFRRRGCH